MSDVEQLIKASQLPGIIRCPVMASPEVQIALKADFALLLGQLFSQKECGNIQVEFVQILVEAVEIALKSEQEPLLFIALLSSLQSNLKLETIQVETLVTLLQKITNALPDIQKVNVTKIDLYKLLFSLFNSLLLSPVSLPLHPKLLEHSGNALPITQN
jgi:hypothetical protein